jgi:hypothetical protein
LTETFIGRQARTGRGVAAGGVPQPDGLR